MSKIWKVTSRIVFDTTFYVLSTNEPDGENVIELAKDGYVPEFKQEPAGPEYLLGIPEETTIDAYLAAWSPEMDVSDVEKMNFLTNLDIKPPEDLSEIVSSDIEILPQV